MASKDVTPILLGDRWIDGGTPVELWLDEGSTGLMLEVAPRTSRSTPALTMVVQRVDDEESTEHAMVVYDPLLAALENEGDLGARIRLLEGGRRDRRQGRPDRERAARWCSEGCLHGSLLADYGNDGAAVVGQLSSLLAERLRTLREAGSGDECARAYSEAVELADALQELGALDDEAADAIDRYHTPSSIPAPERPGRNEPCWCGNGKKYKKCHLDADESIAHQVVLGAARSADMSCHWCHDERA